MGGMKTTANNNAMAYGWTISEAHGTDDGRVWARTRSDGRVDVTFTGHYSARRERWTAVKYFRIPRSRAERLYRKLLSLPRYAIAAATAQESA